MFDKNSSYCTVISKAENGDTSAMYELAMLYDCGAIESSSDSEYVYWLRKFMESDLINAIIDDFDNEDEALPNPDYDFIKGFEYYSMIVEAGIALGLYYMNSSHIEEVGIAYRALYAAFLVSRFDYLTIEDEEGITDILTLLSRTNNRLDYLKGGLE